MKFLFGLLLLFVLILIFFLIRNLATRTIFTMEDAKVLATKECKDLKRKFKSSRCSCAGIFHPAEQQGWIASLPTPRNDEVSPQYQAIHSNAPRSRSAAADEGDEILRGDAWFEWLAIVNCDIPGECGRNIEGENKSADLQGPRLSRRKNENENTY